VIDGIANGLSRTPPNETPAARSERLRESAREFEAVFLAIILKEMRQSTKGFSDEKASFARDTYEGWQDELFSRSMASGQGIGLAEVLYRQLQQQQIAQEPEKQ